MCDLAREGAVLADGALAPCLGVGKVWEDGPNGLEESMVIKRISVLTAVFGLLLIFAVAQDAPAQSATQVGTEPLSCADHFITARAVRSPEGVEAFVQCAYEFVQEVGFEEARRAL